MHTTQKYLVTKKDKEKKMKKIIVSSDKNTRNRIIKGAKIVADTVGKTLGIGGRNAIILKKYRSPLCTNDGVTVARHIVLDDEIEDLGAQVTVEACMKTNEMVGDATTSTAVLVGVLLDSVQKRTAKNVLGMSDNTTHLAREILDTSKKVIEKIKSQAKELNDDDLLNVAVTSLGNAEYGKIVADMMKEIGRDGYISVEDNWLTQYGIDTEINIGLRKLARYASPYFSTNSKKEAIWEDAKILVCNEDIETAQAIQKLINEILKSKDKKLVIINGSEGEGFSKPFIISTLNTLSIIKQGQTNLPNPLLIKAPSLTSEELEDIAVFCNAKFINKNQGMKLSDVSIEQVPSDLGFAKKVVVNDNEMIITGGAGDTTFRIKTLNDEIEIERDTMFKEKMKRRIADLSSGVGIIRVGATTEQERTHLKDKIEDAKNACKASMEEGTIRGGGIPLKEIAEELGKDSILYEALQAPYNKIQENYGEKLEIADNIIDSAKATRLAVQNACSVVAKLITTDIGISERTKSLWDDLEKKLHPVDENDSFRDDENLDIR